MRQRKLLWAALGVFLVLAAVWVLWRPGRAPTTNVPASATSGVASTAPAPAAPTSASASSSSNAITATAARQTILQHRVSNTPASIKELTRNEHAVLLRNALIDTTRPLNLNIPARFQAPTNTSSYIVQARGAATPAFHALLISAGARVISYIPNNAFLVRVAPDHVGALRASPLAEAVLPFEPFYKVDARLFDQSFTQYRVLGYPGEETALAQGLQNAGATILSQDQTPLGTILTVEAPQVDVATLAGIDALQVIEPKVSRAPANDLIRVSLGVSSDTISTTNNYLGLTGSNVVVNINDTGVDAKHPDLVPRVTADSPATEVDPDGHGTFVAGVIASSGEHSADVMASGSVSNANFHGMAPAASLYAMRAVGSDNQSDTYLQETAAANNASIVNNSWGYPGNFDYDLAAATYDAAVRDALPSLTGSQPLTFVFAAGNRGFGADNGLGGESGSIVSPATSKNSLTVGASELVRNITNEVVRTNFDVMTTNGFLVETNQPWKGETDASDEVAPFSSRGNVGAGIEGDSGRFKPDVVAPGVFAVSTRSEQWDQKSYYNPVSYTANRFRDRVIPAGSQGNYSIFVPYNAVVLTIQVLTNSLTPVPRPDMPIYVKQSAIPTTNAFDVVKTNHVSLPGDYPLNAVDTSWYYSVRNPYTNDVSVDIRTIIGTTNDLGNYYQVLSNLNETLDPKGFYRYESGSSVSAGAVSGTLALMEQFFEQRLQPLYGPTRRPSPALLKALVINGARSLGPLYNLGVDNTINYEGWGIVNLTNSLPSSLSNLVNQADQPTSFMFYDQSPTNALTTGESKTRHVKLTDTARIEPLRVTLVWTDPPGNPVAGPKLVNDLDLVVTNLDTGDVYFGNDIPAGQDYTRPAPTNSPPNVDVINNVENVFVRPPLGTNYAVTVVGRRVNVNAVTAQTDGIAQDYALVISCGNGDAVTNAFTVTDNTPVAFTNEPLVAIISSNGVPLLNQHVGANFPLITTTNGTDNQWHFFVFTNSSSFADAGPNVAFVTFIPPDLSVPRIGVREKNTDNATRPEADIDLYVSTDPNLLKLNSTAIANSLKSLGSGGTETIALTNAPLDQVYYVGVKSEDQMAAEFGFLAVSSKEPFSTLDAEGNQYVRGLSMPVVIPDGTPADPGGVYVFGIAIYPMLARKVVVTNTITHENMGDLSGNLSHNRQFVVLNNHRAATVSGLVSQTSIYDDSGEFPIPGATPSDGPGSLRNFVAEQGVGLWLLTEVDNALGQTGRVDNLGIRIEPLLDFTNQIITIPPHSFFYDAVDVPPEATNLTVTLANMDPPSPLELYIRKGDFPTRTAYDKYALINPPGGSLSLGLYDTPPLSAGRYYIGVYNPNSVAITVNYSKRLDLAGSPVSAGRFVNTGETPLLDDAVSRSYIAVTNDEKITRAEVGVVVQHPRVADVALTLVSPSGKRILLAENRGGLTTAGYGKMLYTTNVYPQSAQGGPAADTNVISVGANSGTLYVNYDFFPIPDQMQIFYDGAKIFDTGLVSSSNHFSLSFGPGASTDLTIVMNPGDNTNAQTKWEYVATVVSSAGLYAVFTDDHKKTTTPIKFATPPFAPAGSQTASISGFETDARTYVSNDVFDGWTVFTNHVVVATNPPADTGSKYLDILLGGVSRNLNTTPGDLYTLQFASRGISPRAVVAGFTANDLYSFTRDGSFLEQFGKTGNRPQGVTVGPDGKVYELNQQDGTIQRFAPDGRDLGLFGNHVFTRPNEMAFDASGNVYVTDGGGNLVGKLDPNGNFLGSIASPTLTDPSGLVFDEAGNLYVASYSNNLVREFGPNGADLGDFISSSSNLLNHPYGLIRDRQGNSYIGNDFASQILKFSPAGQFIEYVVNGGLGRLGQMSTDGHDLYVAGTDSGKVYRFPKFAGPAQTFMSGLAEPRGCAFLPLNRVVHGSFEMPQAASVGHVLSTGASIPGWTVGQGSVDLEDRREGAPALVAADGSQYVDLSGNAGDFGSVYQDINTVPGKVYRLRFAMAGQYDLAVDPVRSLKVTVGLQTLGTFTFDATGTSPDAPGWQYHEVLFTAAAASSRLTFESLDNSGSGPALDDVTVTPEPAAFVSLGTMTNQTVAATTNWTPNSVSFVATGNSTPITARGIEPGIGLDTLTLVKQQNAVYYLPESSLADLIGENAKGTWTLEAWDTRTGATNVTPRIVSWKLDLAFENTQPLAQPLFHAQPRTNTVPPGIVQYYYVDVPLWANFATNTLTNLNSTDGLNLWQNRTTLPVSGNPPDFSLLLGQASGSTNLSNSSIPPLQPGKRYYLAVQNTNATSVTYSIGVQFDITLLTNAVPFTTPQGSLRPRYYAFDVSTNAAAIILQTTNANGNVDLVLRQKLPPPTTELDSLPDLTAYDYGSFNSGTQDERIVVTTNTLPVKLAPGRWYAGVFNQDPVSVDYTILYSEYTSIEPVIIDYQVHSNELCLTWMSVPGFSYYVEGKVDLADPTWVPISPAIVATEDTTTYCIPLPTPYQYFRVRLGVPPTVPQPNTPIEIEPNSTKYFAIPVPDWPYAATNTLVYASQPVNLLFNQDGLPAGGPGDVALLTNASGGVFVLTTNSIPPLVTNRTYYLGLENTNSTSVTALLNVEFNSTLLTNGEVLSDTLLSPIPRYFTFEVPPDSVLAAFSLFNMTSNADLVAQEADFGPPSLTTYDYGSFNPGTANDVITITTNSAPPLTTNTWALSVFNRTTGSVGYSIRAVAATNTVPIIIDTQDNGTNLCFTWSSIPGLNYYVAGKVNVDDPVWVPVSPTITAEDFVTTYCLALPTPYHYFTIRVGTAPIFPDPGTPVTIPVHELAYFRVPVGDWPYAATNTLISASAPVDLLFNQNGLPTGATPGDVTLLTNQISGVFTLLTNSSPSLVTNRDYFLGVSNRNDTPVTALLGVEFNSTPLTNGMVLSSRLLSVIPRYFSFAVPSNSLEVAFELTNLTGNADLVIRRAGLAQPTLTDNDYGSFNTGSSNELITLTTNSAPIPLSTNGWNLAVFNRDQNPVDYTIHASALINTNVSPNPEPVIIDTQVSTTELCLTWSSIPGTNYYVVGKVALEDTNWVAVSPTITATAPTTTYCIALPSPYHYFRVNVGIAPPSFPEPGVPTVEYSTTNLCLTWNSIPGTNYYVVARTDLTDTNWVTISPTITATDTNTTFCIDLPSPFHFFSVRVGTAPGTSFPEPGVPTVEYSTTNLCLTWNSAPGTNYYVVGRIDITDTNWVPVSPTITATDTSTTFCIDLPSPYHFFKVEVGTAPPPVVPEPGVPTVEYSTTNLCLTWNSIPGTNYYVVARTDLNDTNWVTISPTITATDTNTTFCIDLPSLYHFFSVRVGIAPSTPFPEPGVPTVEYSTTNLCLTWNSAPGTNYYVVGRTDITDTNWVPISPTITATDTNTSYCIDLPSPFHFFSVRVGTVQAPPPPEGPVILGTELSGTNVCLTWSSIPGTNYYIAGIADLTDTNWVPASAAVPSGGDQTTYCLDLPSPYHFFQVIEGSPPSSPPTTPLTFDSIVQTGGSGFTLNWQAPVTARFQVQWTSVIPTNSWNTFSNVITASATNGSVGTFHFTDDGSQGGGVGQQRFYQLLQLP